jgi:hypothetical protein
VQLQDATTHIVKNVTHSATATSQNHISNLAYFSTNTYTAPVTIERRLRENQIIILTTEACGRML